MAWRYIYINVLCIRFWKKHKSKYTLTCFVFKVDVRDSYTLCGWLNWHSQVTVAKLGMNLHLMYSGAQQYLGCMPSLFHPPKTSTRCVFLQKLSPQAFSLLYYCISVFNQLIDLLYYNHEWQGTHQHCKFKGYSLEKTLVVMCIRIEGMKFGYSFSML